MPIFRAMRTRPRLARVTMVVVVLVALLAACDDDGDNDNADTAADDSAAPSLLYAQQAEQATLEPASGNGSATYTLTLQNVAPRTIYFSDRPDRIAGSLDNEAFVRLETLFVPDNPPNAALVVSEPQSEDEDVVIVELTQPRYDAGTRAFSYEAVVIDEISDGLSDWEPRQDQSLPSQLGHVSLFIDSDPDSACPGQVSWDKGTVVVTVTNGDTQQPLPGAQVQLFGTSSPTIPSYTGTTPGSGQLTFSVDATDALIQGYYRTVVTLQGYVTLQENVTVCPDQTVKVTADLDPA